MTGSDGKTGAVRNWGWAWLLVFLILWYAGRGFAVSIEASMLVAVVFFLIWAAWFFFIEGRSFRSRLAGIPDPALWLVVSIIAIVWGADLEWPGDNWEYWSRPQRAKDLSEIQGIGEFLNLIWYHCVPDRFWRLEPVVPTFLGTLLILSQAYRLGREVECRGWFLNAAVIFSFLSWGVYGFPLLRQVILGKAALGLAVQIATFVELLRLLKSVNWRFIPRVVIGFWLAAQCHEQSLLMLIVGSSGLGAWWIVRRFGWAWLCMIGLLSSLIFGWLSNQYVVPHIVSADEWDWGKESRDWLGKFWGFDFIQADIRKLWLLALGSWGVLGIAFLPFLIWRKNPVGFICGACVLALLFLPSANLYFALLLDRDVPSNFNRLLMVLPWSFPVMLGLWELSQMNDRLGRFLVSERVIAAMVLFFLLFGLSPEEPIYGKNSHYIGRRTYEGSLSFYDDLVQLMSERTDESTRVLADKTTLYVMSACFGSQVMYPGLREEYSSLAGAPIDWQANMEQLIELLRSYDFVIAVRSFQGEVSSRRSLMTEASGNVRRYGLKKNLAYVPEIVAKLDRIAATEGWTVRDVGPNFRVYEVAGESPQSQ